MILSSNFHVYVYVYCDFVILKVTCEVCTFEWCYKCQSPVHAAITCKENKARSAIEVTNWAKNTCNEENITPKKCPVCKACKFNCISSNNRYKDYFKGVCAHYLQCD